MALLFALIALVLLGFGAGSTSTGGSRARIAPTGGATLRFVSLSPVTVRGAHFRPGEHVRVVVHAGLEAVGERVTSRGGRFTATLPVSVDTCAGATAQAIGDRGSRASAAIAIRACPPAE
jgi:hypothetical protein